MIYDNLKNIENYIGKSTNLDVIIQYITNNDYQKLPIGRTDISDSVFVNVFEYEIDETNSNPFEFHELYGDVHMVTKNQELIHHTDIENVTITTPYDSASDVGLGTSKESEACLIDREHFYVAFPSDAHQVKMFAGYKNVRKVVFKFKID